MTPEQEKKLDRLLECSLRTEGDIALVRQEMGQHREAILEQEKNLAANNKRVDSLEGDRNKVVGAMWVTGTGTFAGFISLIISLFKK